MRTRPMIVALALPLVVTAPAFAQQLIDQGSQRVVSSAIAAPHDPRAPGAGFISGTAGVRVARDTFIVEDGSANVRKGVVGSLPVAENVSVGLGLYKVSRYSNKEPNFVRLRPMEDVDGRHQRIAAVGLSVRF